MSVVVPAHNAGRTIGRALRSVDLQTVRPREVIVVDDRSTDDTRTVVAATDLSVPVRVVASERPGAGAARNAGVAAAEGDLVAFLDADDLWYPTKLEEQLPLLTDDVALVGALVHYVGTDGEVLGTNARYQDWGSATEDLRSGAAMPVPLTTLVVRREAFLRHGGFDESFLRTQDLELASRLVQDGSLVWPERRILGAYSIHGTSATATTYREQFLAAELVRARLSGRSTASYEEWQRSPQISADARRAAASGEHYRAAAVAKGEGRRLRFLRHAVQASVIDPLGVARKARSRTVNQDSLTPREVPMPVRRLLGPPEQQGGELVSHPVAGLQLVEDPTLLIDSVPESYLADPRPVTVLAAHVSSLNAAVDPAFVAAFNTADVAYADGISMTLIAKSYGYRAEKLATTDLAPQLLDQLGQKLGRPPRLVVIGGEPGVAEEGAKGLAGMTPVSLVMAEHGYQDDWSQVLERVRAQDPDVLVLGLGMPNEAFWLARYRAELPDAIVITCGGWLRLLAEHEERAPDVMQRLELEWLWRIITDPRRTWRRYTAGAMALTRNMVKGYRSRL